MQAGVTILVFSLSVSHQLSARRSPVSTVFSVLTGDDQVVKGDESEVDTVDDDVEYENDNRWFVDDKGDKDEECESNVVGFLVVGAFVDIMLEDNFGDETEVS